MSGSSSNRGRREGRQGESASVESCNCPHCGEACDREEVDVGVGVIHGPWGCAGCGWSSDPAYDSREGVRKDGDDRVYDQYGVSHHVSRPGGMAVLAGANVQDRGKEG